MLDTESDVENRRAKDASPPKSWGIYVYFAADVPDPAMQAAVWKTLRTIASVGSSDMVKITAMIDLPNRDTEYYIIPRRPPGVARWPILPDRFLSNVDSASMDTILDFFEWSHHNCPADNIALIFYGHGYALDDYDPQIQPGGAQTVQKAASDSKGRTADTFPGEHGNELKLIYDSTHNSVLNNSDFAQAIRDYSERFNGREPIQVLGLDCCSMAMSEVLSELQGVAEYAVAAESGLPFESWLSAPILQRFLDTPHTSAKEFGEDAVQHFVDIISSTDDMYVVLSACNLRGFAKLETAMKAFVGALLPAIDKYENRRAVAQAWENDVSFAPDGLIDLASFCDLLIASIGKNPITSTEAAVIETAEEVIEKVLDVVTFIGIAPDPTGRRISLSMGLSIWFPPWIQFPDVQYFQMKQSMDYLARGYSSTHFAMVTGWDRFLCKLYLLTQR
jgi:hypothetical protein